LMGFDVTGDDPLEHVLQVLEGIETIHFGALCRTLNYAEATFGSRSRPEVESCQFGIV
jgi:hypothetical protein